MTGHLENNVGIRIADITIRALDNESATVLYDETVSDENGDFYFDGPLTSTTRTSTDPSSGRFLFSSTEFGLVTVTATLENGKAGSTSLPMFRGKDATGGSYVMHYTRVYIEGNGNPNPECSN